MASLYKDLILPGCPYGVWPRMVDLCCPCFLPRASLSKRSGRSPVLPGTLLLWQALMKPFEDYQNLGVKTRGHKLAAH
jgi:hypothetical protein